MSTGNSLGSISSQSGFALFGRHVRLSLRALIASVFCLAGAVALQPEALAELADKTGLSAYEAALKETGVARQIPALEHFLNIAGNGPLTTSALEFLVWDYLQTGAPVQAARPAKALLALIREMQSRWRHWLTPEWEARPAMPGNDSGWRRAAWPSLGICKSRWA